MTDDLVTDDPLNHLFRKAFRCRCRFLFVCHVGYTRTHVLHIRLTEVEFRPLIWLQECAQWMWVGADGLLE